MKIIAYGSLLNSGSLAKTLGRVAELKPIELAGYARVFNAPFGEYAFFNLVSEPESVIEAAYFELAETEVERFMEREKGSQVLEVLPDYYAFVWPEANCRELPVLQSYIDVCQSGCDELKIDLWPGTKMPAVVVDDRQAPLYL